MAILKKAAAEQLLEIKQACWLILADHFRDENTR